MSSRPTARHFLRQIFGKPDLGIVMSTFVFALILVSSPQLPLFNVFSDQDPPWLIKTGVWILEHQAIPTHNPFANGLPDLGNIPIVCYQWLFELLLGIAYKFDGLVGVTILVAVLYSLFILGLYRWLQNKGLKPIPHILLPLAFGLLMLKSCAIARPILASCLLTPVLLILLDSEKEEQQAWTLSRAMTLWLLVALWANLHLGFITGLVIAGVFLITEAFEKKTWRPIGILSGCFAASLVNPYGIGLYSYFAQLADSPFMNAMITELKPIPFHTATNALMFFVLSTASACVAWKSPRFALPHKILWLLSLGAGLYSSKHAYLFAVFSLPLLGTALEGAFRYCRQHRWGKAFAAMENSAFNSTANTPWAWLAVWIIATIAFHGSIKPSFSGVSELRGVMGYLNHQGMRERILCNEMWGSYLLFYTDARCVLDTRMDMYGDDYVRKYLSLYYMNAAWQKSQKPHDSWQETYRREMAKGLRYAIYPKTEMAALILQNVYHWTPLYRDNQVVLLKAPTISP